MSKAKITREIVKEFVTLLEKAGKYPTTDLIRAMNSNQGSKETIGKYLRELGYPPRGKTTRASQNDEVEDASSETDGDQTLAEKIRSIALKGAEDRIMDLAARVEALEAAGKNIDTVKSVASARNTNEEVGDPLESAILKARIAQAVNMLISVHEEFDGVKGTV